MSHRVLIDDRLLVEELLGELPVSVVGGTLCTSAYWYYRACRAAVAGGGGHLSGPFAQLGADLQELALLSLLDLKPEIGLPDARALVPTMAMVARRHPRLNLLNIEAVAAALELEAEVWLSEPSAAGVLPVALDAEGVAWTTISIPA